MLLLSLLLLLLLLLLSSMAVKLEAIEVALVLLLAFKAVAKLLRWRAAALKSG